MKWFNFFFFGLSMRYSTYPNFLFQVRDRTIFGEILKIMVALIQCTHIMSDSYTVFASFYPNYSTAGFRLPHRPVQVVRSAQWCQRLDPNRSG